MNERKKFWLFVTLALVFLRFTLLFPFRQCMYSRFLNPLPLLLLGLFLLHHFWQKGLPQWNRFKIILLGVNLFVVLTVFIQMATGISLWYVLIPRLSSILYVFFFPLALVLMNFKTQDCLQLIRKLSFVVIWVGGMIALVSSILIYGLGVSPYAIMQWGFPQDLAALYGSSYKFDGHIRMLGLLFNLEHSEIAVAATTVFLLAQELASQKRSKKFVCATIIFGALTFPLYSSITACLVGAGSIMLTIFFLAPKKWKLYASLIMPFFILFFFYLNPDVWGKLEHYVKRWFLFVPQFVPNIRGCFTTNFLWAPFRDAGYNLHCSFKEIHSLSYIPEFGLIPVLPWFVLLFSPLAFLWRWKKIPRAHLPALFMMICYLGGAIHYSGVENWGNNYLFILAALVLLRGEAPVQNQ